MEANDAMGLIKLLRDGGAIVSSAEMSVGDIADAKAARRLWVDAQGYGYVYKPARDARDRLEKPEAERGADTAEEARRAATLAICSLDSITCPDRAPCEGPVSEAISLLLPLANPSHDENWTAIEAVRQLVDRKRP